MAGDDDPGKDAPDQEGPEGQPRKDEGPGEKTVPATGIVIALLWLVLLSGVDLYCLTALWPHPTPSTSQPNATTTAVPAPDCGSVDPYVRDECKCTVRATQAHNRFYSGTIKPEEKFDPSCARLFGCWFVLWGETRLLLIVMLCGFLGALIYSLRSFLWYAGNRNLVRSWLALYALVPLVGAMLAVVFYLVLRGGLFSPSTTISDTSPFGFAAVAALVGMFTNQAAEKLRSVFETLLQKASTGKNPSPRALPVVTSVTPASIASGASRTITVNGDHFAADSKVVANGTELVTTFKSEKVLEATVPQAMIPAAGATLSITVTTPNAGKSASDVKVPVT